MKEAGKDPLALKNMPEIPLGYAELLRHFNRLSFSRSHSMSGPNPIDFTSIYRYNQVIARLDLDFFLDVVQILDRFYLKGCKETPKTPQKK